MSSGEQPGGGSRHTNQTNSVTPQEPGNSPSGESASDELPTPDECVAEFMETYDDRAVLPVTGINGTSLRAGYTNEVTEEFQTEALGETERSASGTHVTAHEPVAWHEAVRRLLKSHAEARQTRVNLVRGRPADVEYAEFSVEAETRWFASYQKKYYAQMNGWLREVCGGTRPSGGETDAAFDDPHIALITLSASSTPTGRVSPVDHANRLRDSWDSVYHTLRNTMRDLGVEWQYDRRSEPHTSKRGDQRGTNACYSHDHIVLVTDQQITPEDLRPIVEKHVDGCDWAGADAHDLDVPNWNARPEDVGTVTIRRPDELENVAAYVADYCSIQPDDLLERSTEYQAWAAAMSAGNIKTVTRSNAAKQAATADSCKQRAESQASEQEDDHGENLVRSSRRGVKLECACCGSPHGIDQQQTLSASRLEADSPRAATDGGLDLDQERTDDLRNRWESARGAVTWGESLKRAAARERLENAMTRYPRATDARLFGLTGLPPKWSDLLVEIRAGLDREHAVGFQRGPAWRVDSVTVGETTYPASSGNGVDLVEASGIEHDYRRRLDSVLDENQSYRCECGVSAYGETMAKHLRTHGLETAEHARHAVTPE